MKSPLGMAARLLIGLPLLALGMLHLSKSGMAYRVLPGWPMGQALVVVSSLCLMAAAIAILSGIMARLAATLLGVEFLVFVVALHVPNVMSGADEAARLAATLQLLKDTMLAGGAFAIAALSDTRRV
jgi:uncharacterized membrane protein YphA (DoxX/SURF4 family)